MARKKKLIKKLPRISFELLLWMLVIVVVIFLFIPLLKPYFNHSYESKIVAQPTQITSANKPIVKSTPTAIPIALPAPISGWKTYTNSAIRVSFQYPPTWTLENYTIQYEGLATKIQGDEGKIITE